MISELSELQQGNRHYHCAEKGCKIMPKDYYSREKHIIHRSYCKTHKKELCRCGWEWHWHGGEHHLPLKIYHSKHGLRGKT